MKPSPSARLLLRSLVAVLGGVAACSEGDGRSGAHVGEVGSSGAAGRGGGATSGVAGAAGAAGDVIGGASGAGGEGSGGVTGLFRAGDCADGSVVLVEGAPSGMVKCPDGSLARTGPTRCHLPDLSARPACPAPGATPPPERCAKDPCLDGPHGRPHQSVSVVPSPTACDYYCESDGDCPGQSRCACDADGYGQCRSAACESAESCAEGETCRVAAAPRLCDPEDLALDCVSVDAACVLNEHCTASQQQCREQGQGRRCAQGQGACGRPILVDAIAMVAPLVPVSSWSHPQHLVNV